MLKDFFLLLNKTRLQLHIYLFVMSINSLQFEFFYIVLCVKLQVKGKQNVNIIRSDEI